MQQIVHRFPDAAARLYPRPNAEQALRQLTPAPPENPPQPVNAADRLRQQRAAAEFFIEHPQAAAVEPLARLIPTIPPEDTHLRHAARIALRNCLRDTSDGWTHARLRRADIAAERETPLSLMPANFGQILPEAELYHLLAYLLQQTTR